MAISKIDNALQQLITMFGDCTKIKKVWQNASPDSVFTQQELTIPGLEKKTKVGIVMLNAVGSAVTSEMSCNYISGKKMQLTVIVETQESSSFLKVATRLVTINTNKINIGDCKVKQANQQVASTNNNYCIPFEIYIMEE